MILYCNGCSYTYGTELSLGDLKLAWPYLVAKKLDATLINSSQAGQSNLMIYKKTVEDILSLEKKPDLAIIQWTFFERFITPVGKKFLMFNPNTLLKFQTHLPFDHDRAREEDKDWYKNYYDIKNTLQIEHLTDLSMFYMFMLQSFLSAKRIPFIFMDCDNNRRYGTNSLKVSNKFYSEKLKSENWLHELDTSLNEILFSHNYKLCRQKDSKGFLDDHFMANAHEFLSESILDFFHLKEKLRIKKNNLVGRQRDPIHFYGDDM